MRRLVALAAVLALFLVGCGDDGGDDVDPLAGGPAPTDAHGGHADHSGNPTSTCEPSGTALTIAAQNTKFDNKDQTVHNLMILESHSASEALFDAGTIPNGIRTLNIPALKAGTFAFHCKIHPGAMSGTFVVK